MLENWIEGNSSLLLEYVSEYIEFCLANPVSLDPGMVETHVLVSLIAVPGLELLSVAVSTCSTMVFYHRHRLHLPYAKVPSKTQVRNLYQCPVR